MKILNWLKAEALSLFIMAAPFVFVAIYWDKFPETMPIHWGADGKPNGFGSRTEGLLLLPCINIFTFIMMKVAPLIDPKKASYQLMAKKLPIITNAVLGLMTVIFFAMTLSILYPDINSIMTVFIALCIMNIVLGNYMGTLRHNYFIGVKTPWTLSNEEVWNLTHRWTGKLWVWASIVMLALIFCVNNTTYIFIMYVVVISLPPIVYSYLKYKQLEKNLPE